MQSESLPHLCMISFQIFTGTLENILSLIIGSNNTFAICDSISHNGEWRSHPRNVCCGAGSGYTALFRRDMFIVAEIAII